MRHTIIGILMGTLLAIGCGDEGSNGGGAGAGAEEDDGLAKMGAPEGATETNVVPAACEEDDDCPEGIECLIVTEGDVFGYCDVPEMQSEEPQSSAAPALCDDDEDCPEGVSCVEGEEGSGVTYCDVDDGAPISPSSAAPAPCDSDDACPEGIECIGLDEEGGPGFCDVLEMAAP